MANEYEQMLGPTRGPAEENEYGQMLDDERSAQTSELKQSMFVAKDTQPDRKAQVLQLSQKMNLPAEIVERNFDEVSKDASLSHDYDAIIDQTPKLAEWLKDSNNAALGKDDLEGLGKIEQTVKDHNFMTGLRNWLGAGMAQMSADLSKIPALAYDVAAYPQNKFNELIGRDVRVTSDDTFFGRSNPITKGFADDAEAFRTESPELTESMLAELQRGNYSEAAKVLLAQTIANAPQQVFLLASGIAGYEAAGLAMAGAASAAQKNAENLEKGIDPIVGVPNALATGSIESGFESLGTLGFLKAWEHAFEKQAGKAVSREVIKAYFKTLAQNVLGEATEEGLTSLAQDLTDKVSGVNPDALEGALGRAVEAGAIGGFSGGLMTGPMAASGHLLERRHEIVRAEQAKNFFRSLMQTAEATKLRQRMPEAQRNLVEQIVKDGPVENVYISTDKFEEYFQKSGVNPVQIAGELGLSEQYDEAKETGLDLRIPLATMVDKLAGTEHEVGLENDIKFSPDGLSVSEVKELHKQIDETQKAIEAETRAAEETPAESQSSAEQIRETIAEQLRAAGVEPSQAILAEKGFETLGQRLGVDPLDLFKRYRLYVSRGEMTPEEAAHDQQVFEQAKLTFSHLSGAENVIDASSLFSKASREEPVSDPDKEIQQQAKESLGEKIYSKISLHGAHMLNSLMARYGEDNKKIKYAIRGGQRGDLGPYVSTKDMTGIGWVPNYAAKPTGVIGPARISEPFSVDRTKGVKGAVDGKMETDPFKWAEDKYGATRELIKKHADAGIPLTINTSSDLIAKDDYIALLPHGTTVNLYMLTNNDELNRILFPGNPSNKRLEGAAKKLKDAGVKVKVIRPSAEEVISAVGGEQSLKHMFGDLAGTPELRAALVEATSPRLEVLDGGKKTLFQGSADDLAKERIRKALEDAFNSPDAIERYNALPESAGGIHIDPDNARNLFEPYASSREGKILHLDATGKLSSEFAERAFEERLTQEPGPVIMTAGGSASGKTNYATKFAKTNKDAVAIFDSTAANYKAVKERVEKALAAGHDVEYHLIYAPFDQAIEGNKARFKSTGRLVDPHTMAYTHVHAIDVFRRLIEDFKDNPRFSPGIFQRNGEKLTWSEVENLDKLRYDREGKSLRSAMRALEKQATEALKNEVSEVREAKTRLNAATEGAQGVGQGNPRTDQGSGSSESGLPGGVLSEDGREVKKYDQDARGRLVVDPYGFNIQIFKNADLSTFIHELGHFYHLVLRDLATRENTPRQIKDDLVTLEKWAGAESGTELTTEHYENIARGFEAYLMEGKAPSSALRQTFQRFKQWLVDIYRELRNLNVELTDDVRSVFDRLLATDDEIRDAKAIMDTPVLFNDPINMGMSEAKAHEYIKARALAEEEAKEELTQKLMNEFKREQTAAWNEKREKVKTEVTVEANKRPEFIALSVLQKGVMPDGSPLPRGMKAVKLSRKAIVDRFGEERLKTLPKPYVYSKEGGLHPNTAAEIFGFKSGEQLLRALETAGAKDNYIERVTDERMRAEHGDMRTDGALPQEAINAIHNDKRAQLLRRELEIMVHEDLPVFKEVVRRASRPIPKIEQVRQQAEEIIGRKQVRDINPIVFERAQSKYAKLAVETMLKGDFDGAFNAKMKELLNHELHRAATNAREEVEKTLDYLKKFRKASKREQLGRTDYLEQIDNILSRFEIAAVSNRELAKRDKTLVEWIEAKQKSGESLGEEIYAPDFLKSEGYKKHFKNLTYEEMTGMRDAVKQIEHMAIRSDKNLSTRRAIRREQIKTELISSLIANVKKKAPRPLTDFGMNRKDRALRALNDFDVSLIKMEQAFDWMDGGELSGPWQSYLWHPVSDAQAAEYDYTAKITSQIAKLVVGMPKEIRSQMSEEVAVPGIDRKLVRRDLIGVALNVGNESNYRKLLNGHGWSEQQVRLMLDNLTKEEWGLVQGIWDTLESMWPDIAKLQKKLTGLEPDKVEIRPVTTKFGKLKGGYYPLIYDHIASTQGQLQLGARVGGLVEKAYVRATTPKGHTKSRIEEFSAPIDLDIDNLPGHVASVIKDLTHREWLMDANWIIDDRDIRAAVADHMGPEYVGRLNDWVHQVVNDRNHASMKSLSAWRKMIEHFRYNAIIAAMGFKASVMLSQFAGAGNSVEVIGGKDLDGRAWFLRGVRKVLQHPMQTYNEVTEKSGEMRHRFETRDRDIRDHLRVLEGREDMLAKVQETAMHGIGLMEMLVSLPTWQAAYEKALVGGSSEELAIRAGDRAVRLSQGASGAKDLTAVMAKDEQLMRVLTMFYTPFAALYARLRDIGHSVEGAKDLPQALVRSHWAWIFGATVAALASGGGPDQDKDEAWLEWWGKTVAMYPFMTVPFVRDVVNAVAGEYGYTFTPLEQAIKSSIKPAKTAQQVYSGDKELSDLAADTFQASGYWLGLPTNQLSITGGYLKDLYTGNENPDDLGEFAHNMILKRKHE